MAGTLLFIAILVGIVGLMGLVEGGVSWLRGVRQGHTAAAGGGATGVPATAPGRGQAGPGRTGGRLR